MAGNKKWNSDLELQGKAKIHTVPNSQGTVLTYNQSTKEVSHRTYSELINDFDLKNKFLSLNYTSTTTNDANLLRDNGIYYGFSWLNVPINTIAVLTVKVYSPDWIRQTFEIPDGSGRTWTRDYHSGTTWGEWVEQSSKNWTNENFHKVSNLIQGDTNNIQPNTSNSLYYAGLNNSPWHFSQDSIGSIINLAGKACGIDIASFNVAHANMGLFYRSYKGNDDPSSWKEIWTSHTFNPDTKVTSWENAIAIGFQSGSSTGAPYFYHKTDGYVFLATQDWVSQTLQNAHTIDASGNLNNVSDSHTNKTWFDYNWAGTGYQGSVINFSGINGNYSTELFASYNFQNNIGIRTKNGDNNEWNDPKWLWHSGNFNPVSKIDALEKANAVGFSNSLSSDFPYVRHQDDTYVYVARKDWVQNNFVTNTNLSNYMTLDGTIQTTMGQKTFAGGSGNSLETSSLIVKSLTANYPTLGFVNQNSYGGTLSYRFSGGGYFAFMNTNGDIYERIKVGGLTSKNQVEIDMPNSHLQFFNDGVAKYHLETFSDSFGIVRTGAAGRFSILPHGHIKIETNTGFVDIGSQNANYTHFNANLDFAFNRDLFVAGNLVYHAGNLNIGQYVTQTSLNTQLSEYATLAGVQTFTNTNTFEQSPVIPNGTLGNHAVSLGQLDARLTSYALSGWVVSNFQPLNSNLTGISNLLLSNNSVGLLKKDGGPPGSNNWVLDTETYTSQTWVSNNFIPKTHPIYNSTQVNIDNWNGYVGYRDNRQITSASIPQQKLGFGFGSWNNNNTAPYADFLHFGGYQDGSGGSQNLIMFRKDAFGLRQYRANIQTIANYSSYVDYWNTSHFNQNQINNWNDMANSGVRLNQEFTIFSGNGVVIGDNFSNSQYESGLIYHPYDRIISGVRPDDLRIIHFGNRYSQGDYTGLSFNAEEEVFSIGKQNTHGDKLELNGPVSYARGGSQLIIDVNVNFNGDLRFSRYAFNHVHTEEDIYLPDSPIIGQSFDLHNKSNHQIAVYTSTGSFRLSPFSKISGVYNGTVHRWDSTSGEPYMDA